MATMRILSARGDTVVEWDEKQAEVGDREALEAVREAERIFEQQRQKGASAFIVEPGKPARRLENFDPKVEHMIVVPPVAGG